MPQSSDDFAFSGSGQQQGLTKLEYTATELLKGMLAGNRREFPLSRTMGTQVGDAITMASALIGRAEQEQQG